jgi:dTDP-4-amino-4,6-dideoxygalactose transaminase
MLPPPLASWPDYSPEEVDAVARVIASNRVNYWTGDEARKFEVEFATWSQSNHAIALANGTVALDLAIKALGIGPGDEVIVTPRTFIASVSSVVNAGATPIFADVDIDSGNITPETIEAVLTPRTKAIIPVHLGGWPCDMPLIMALASTHKLKVIEDCAQAHGAMIDGKSIGSFGHVSAWSFCQDKIMTTGGEGGMVTTDDPDLWSYMWSFKDHGKSWNAVYNRDHAPGFRWLHESFGTNWRMLEVQAVLGRIQLTRMAEWTKRRGEIAGRLANSLAHLGDAIRIPAPPANMQHAYYRLYGYVEPTALREGWTRDRIVAECTARHAPAFQGSCPEVYREKAFDGAPFRPDQRLPNAMSLGETSVMFLTHPSITETGLNQYCEGVAEVFAAAIR